MFVPVLRSLELFQGDLHFGAQKQKVVASAGSAVLVVKNNEEAQHIVARIVATIIRRVLD
jgi:hypothetical protein